MKDIYRIIGFSLISTLLIFIGKNDYILIKLVEWNILSEKLNIKTTQTVCFIVGIIWASLYLPIQHSRLKKRFNEKEKIFTNLLKYNKKSYFKIIKSELKEHNAEFKTRIFKPKKNLKARWNKICFKKTILELIEIPGISDEFHHKSLCFEINKKETQGLVGKCYEENSLCVDLNLEENTYSLTPQHLAKIGNVGFCTAIPIFNEDQSKITAVVSVDSTQVFDFSNEQKYKWEEHMKYYGAFVDKHTNL